MHFLNNMHRFKKYNIIYVQVTDMPMHCDAWGRERHQRNATTRGFKINPGDTIILSDADEIPSLRTVELYRQQDGLVAVNTPKYNYFLNTLESVGWSAVKMFPPSLLDKMTPQQIRFHPPQVVMDTGWHYSWQGGVDKMIDKFGAISHVECNVPPYNQPNTLLHKLQTLEGLWDKKKYTVVADEISLTQYVRDNLSEFAHMIYRPSNNSKTLSIRPRPLP